jgi:hypothetical protein
MSFMKSYKWNFSYGVVKVQLIHIQYMIKYLNQSFEWLLKYICTLQYIVMNIILL